MHARLQSWGVQMPTPELSQLAQPQDTTQYAIYALCLVIVAQMLVPRLLELLASRKKLNSEGDAEAPKDKPLITRLEHDVDKVTADMAEIKQGQSQTQGLVVECLAAIRQMRDDQKQGLERVHDRIDKHLDGHKGSQEG